MQLMDYCGRDEASTSASSRLMRSLVRCQDPSSWVSQVEEIDALFKVVATGRIL